MAYLAAFGSLLLLVCALPMVLAIFGVSISGSETFPTIGEDGTPLPLTMENASGLLRGNLFHTILEWGAVSIAGCVGILAMVQFRMRRDASLAILGLALACAGAMDAVHALAADHLIAHQAEDSRLIPYTWAVSRLFYGTILLLGVGLFTWWQRGQRKLSTRMVLGLGIAFSALAGTFVWFAADSAALPQVIFPDAALKRPFDLAPLVVFAVTALTVLPWSYRRDRSPFTASLLLAMIPAIAGQLYMAFVSTSIHDGAFMWAHACKALTYLVPLGGLIAVSMETWRRSEQAEKDLVVATARAEEATKAKSDFLSSISQEIRTPMAGVIGMADYLMTSALDNAQADAAETIAGSAGAVLALIDDVQDFSQLETGFVELAEEPLAPRRMLDGILELLSVQAMQNKVRMSAFADPEVPPRVLGDEKRLRQILLKLTSNALRHTRDGEVNLQCEFVEDGYTHVVLRFHVSDTGSGIPDDKRAAILRSFSQAGHEDGIAFGGNGLSLAVTRQMVRLMGGSIWVESTVGQGTSFVFTVRLSRDLDERRQPRVVEEWQGKRLLLAVGSPMRSSQMKRQLQAWGFEVTVANDAWDALRELRATLLMEQCFDLALIDQDMPGRSGEELCEEFRAAEGADGMKLLLMSAPGEVIREENPLWDLRLQTPIKFGSLHNAMQQACGVKRSPLYDRRTVDAEQADVVPDALKVLVAEDDPVNQKVLSKLLERLGCQVDRVCNGEEATERVQTGNYHLVFMDCNMPGLNGFDATRLIRLRESGTGEHTIIIAMTSNARASTREQCLQAGMDDYITKPIRASVLAEALDRWKAGDGAMTEA